MSGQGFFDMREKLLKPPAPPTRTVEDNPLTITQLTQLIEKAIKSGVPAQVLVKGETSNFKLHGASGHAYFTLKDAKACIDCVMFRDDAARLKFMPEDGMELIATGRVAVYPARGRYQLYVTALEPAGQGALELAFRQLCAKLEREGLFSADRKRQLSNYPARIALVTSTQTAALQDMLKVLRRFPWISVLIYHVPVQGDGAGDKIAASITHLNSAKNAGPIDLILLARGGGSLEDLWAFNVESVARAIVASRIPIVTGIGHEIDVSIADLCADYHAHTPTEAAQVVTAHWRNASDTLLAGTLRLGRALRNAFQESRQRLESIERHDFFRRPIQRIQEWQQEIDDHQRVLSAAIKARLQDANLLLTRKESRLQQRHPRHVVKLLRQRFDQVAVRLTRNMRDNLARRHLVIESLSKRLEAVSPQQVLNRGYTMTFMKKEGKLIRLAAAVKPGDRIITRFADGQVESSVEDTRQLKLFD
jgi:exodeoxyribonuclease VII large subunit